LQVNGKHTGGNQQRGKEIENKKASESQKTHEFESRQLASRYSITSLSFSMGGRERSLDISKNLGFGNYAVDSGVVYGGKPRLCHVPTSAGFFE